MWRKTIKKEQNTDLSETIVYLSIKTGYKTNNCGKRSSANSVSKKNYALFGRFSFEFYIQSILPTVV